MLWMTKAAFQRRFFTGTIALIGWFFISLPVQACSLALVLAQDVSSSVDAGEHNFQSRGLASALTDPEVVEAILTVGGIWISAFEWSGRTNQIVHVDWTYLDSPAAIGRVARTIAAAPRGHADYPTSLGYALGFAAVHLRKVPERCARQVVDVAGDGVNNEGFPPASAYRAFDFTDITVNGLVIKGSDPDPEEFYRTQVAKGPSSFVEVANGYQDYAQAMKRKLIREISGASLAMR